MVYVVIGRPSPYAETYVLGVFEAREDAERAAEEFVGRAWVASRSLEPAAVA